VKLMEAIEIDQGVKALVNFLAIKRDLDESF
jgi:hypothetical protein